MSQLKATVFIPTWFGEDYLDELLSSVMRQKVPFDFDVLVYDTESKDRTPDILANYAQRYDNFRYKTIAKEEFGHGKTRQAAALDTKAEFIVYLSQDATPASERWLYEMIRPFEINDSVAAVLGKQEPRAHAAPLLKGEIRSVFRGLGPDLGITLFRNDGSITDEGQLGFMAFYSDVNSAARRSVLEGDVPYRDVSYAEDQLFGRDVIDAGLTKAYSASGAVVHSNDIRLKEYKHRMFDETVGLRGVGLRVDRPPLRFITKAIIKGVIKDWAATLSDEQYSTKRKLYWLVVNPFFHVEKWKGIRTAASVDLSDSKSFKKNSLEAKRTTKQQTRR